MALIPFDDRDGVIWFDGALVPWRDARIHVLSHGLHYASCVFEGQRAYGGRVFHLEEHTDRLFNSAHIMGMQIPHTKQVINDACYGLLRAMNLTDAYLRPVVWRGSEMMAVSAQQSKIHVAIAAWEWPSYFSPEARMKGIRVQTAKWRRPAPDTAPTGTKAAGLYMICTLSKHEAEANGYQDALMLDYRGRIAELTGANIFFVKDGEIHTPTPDCFLDGITRRVAIGLARSRQIKVVERAIMPDELGSFSEVFITGTAVEITPINQIDARTYQVGDITKALMGDFDKMIASQRATVAA